MRLWLPIVGLLVSVPALAASHAMRVELNTLEAAETSCRMTFVIENKAAAVDSLKLDLVVFDTEGIVHRRIITEMGPVRAGRTVVKTFAIETRCPRIGAVLVNDVSACAPGDANTCLDGLDLNSRVKNVRFYK